MQSLQKVKQIKPAKRVGRGYGSGKGGHTSSRGMKGQKSRSSVHILFEGLKVRKSLLNRLPFYRGKNKFKANAKPIVFNVGDLEKLSIKGDVDAKALVEAGVITQGQVDKNGIKILGDGELTKKLTVKLPVSTTAKQKIEKAGGKVE